MTSENILELWPREPLDAYIKIAQSRLSELEFLRSDHIANSPSKQVCATSRASEIIKHRAGLKDR
jgi:hypothetical protein